MPYLMRKTIAFSCFIPNGTFAFELGSRGSGPGELAGPYGLTFGPNGLLAVSDVGNHRVQVFRIQ